MASADSDHGLPQVDVWAMHNGQILQSWRLGPGEYSIGREEGRDLLIPLPQVSRSHAVLRLTPKGRMTLEDLGSRSGTTLGGQAIQKTEELPIPQSFFIADIQFTLGGGSTVAATDLSEEENLQPALARFWNRHIQVDSPDDDMLGKASSTGTDHHLQRKIAIHWATQKCGGDASFERLVRLLARLEHPNISTIYQLGENEEKRKYFTAKPKASNNLAGWLQKVESHSNKARSTADELKHSLDLILKVSDAVAFAHDQGIVHGSLRPEVVFLGDFGEVQVGGWEQGFLVSRGNTGGHLDAGPISPADETAVPSDLFQDPAMGSSEDEMPGFTADVYSLGAILHCLLHRVSPQAFDPNRAGRGFFNQGVPSALNAVIRKAMAEDPTERYPTVAALMSDLEAWKKGFATEAEEAGFVRQFLLLGLRHKVFAAAGLVVAMMGIWFLQGVVASERQARQHLESLHAQAPLFVQVARAQMARQEWSQALRNIQLALELAPDQAEYFLYLGDIQQARLEMKVAVVAYSRAQSLDPNLKQAASRLKQSAAFMKSASNIKGFPFLEAGGLHRQLVEQGRADEAAGVFGRLQEEAGAVEQEVMERFRPMDSEANFQLNEDFTMNVKVNEATNLMTLEPLAELPLRHLYLTRPAATNLAPLRGMPLEYLHIEGMPTADLRPLKGLPLKTLVLTWTKATDLSPLKGMPLESLVLMFTDVADLEPLRGMTNLWYLNLYNALNVTNLAPLEGLPLKDLTIYQWTAPVGITDLSPLRNSRLEVLGCSAVKVWDLSPLRGLPLHYLDVGNTLVTNLTSLSGMTLRTLRFSSTGVKDIRPLAGMPLEELVFDHCPVKDLRPLLNIPTLKRLVVPDGALQIPANIAVIRSLPRLEKLGSERVVENGKIAMKPVSEFWQAYSQILRQKN